MLSVAAGIGANAALGCGGDDDGLPAHAVAEVGDTAITKSDFERALTFATGRGNDPRDYPACVEAKQQTVGAADGAHPTDAELEIQCREEYEQIKSNVMDYLIQAEWTRQEADARGIVLTDGQVQKAVDKAEHGGLLDTQTLLQAGVSRRDLLGRVRQNQLQEAVAEQVAAQATKVSARDIAEYYRRHTDDLVVPDRRETRIVLTKSRVRAQAARAALDAGRSWKRVAAEYSLHVSRANAGRITAERDEDGSDSALAAAIFEARAAELVGPIQDGDIWAVFVVDKVKRSFRQTLAQARARIERALASARERRAMESYTTKYRQMTTCAPGFRVPSCKNAPEGTSSPSA